MFMPVRLVSGVLAGLIATKLFVGLWRLIDREEAPDPEHREVSVPKLVAALVIEGAVFRAVRGLVDHGSREAFRRMTGRWPGEQRPEEGRA